MFRGDWSSQGTSANQLRVGGLLTLIALQGFGKALGLVNEGVASILGAIQGYQKQSVILRSWQDVFVDLVQGQVQHLFLSLLQGPPPSPSFL